MGRSWVAVLIGCLALAAPAGAAELEGFGPIKFGMTMEEAYEAIKKNGRLHPDAAALTYNYPLFDTKDSSRDEKRKKEAAVVQFFTKGRASWARVQYFAEQMDRESCIVLASQSAASISHKYGVEPVVRPNFKGRVESRINSMFFTFGFKNTGTLQLVVTFKSGYKQCEFEASYFPPLQEVNPF